MLFASIRLDLGPDYLLGPGEGTAVGVVDDGQLVEVEEAVGDVDILQRVADVAARVAGDEDLWRQLSEECQDFSLVERAQGDVPVSLMSKNFSGMQRGSMQVTWGGQRVSERDGMGTDSTH